MAENEEALAVAGYRGSRRSPAVERGGHSDKGKGRAWGFGERGVQRGNSSIGINRGQGRAGITAKPGVARLKNLLILKIQMVST